MKKFNWLLSLASLLFAGASAFAGGQFVIDPITGNILPVLGKSSGGGGSVSLSSFGSSPNVNAATLTGSVLNLQPADATHPGGVSILDQTFFGEKTFSNTYTPLTTAPTFLDPLADAGYNPDDGPPLNEGDVVSYRVYSYTFVNGTRILSTNFFAIGPWTVPAGTGGAVALDFNADTNPLVAGYYVVRNLNSAGFVQWADILTSTSGRDQLNQFEADGPGGEANYASDPGLPTTYPESVILPHIVNGTGSSTAYAIYAPGKIARFGSIELDSGLSVLAGGTGKTDGTFSDGNGGSSADFYHGLLTNGGATEIDWWSERLYHLGQLRYDWQNGYFYDTNAVTPTMNVISREWYAPNGALVGIWGSSIGVIFQAKDASTPAVSIARRTNTDTGNLLQFQNQNNVNQMAVDNTGLNWILDTTTGTKFGTSTSQKLAFYNSTPIVKPTGDIATALSNLGLVASPTLSFPGHIITSGTAPAVSACGTSPSIAGNDQAGVVTIGTGGSATTCTVTFNVGYGAAPHCFLNDQTDIGLVKATTTTTVLTITKATAFTAGSKIDYFCAQ